MPGPYYANLCHAIGVTKVSTKRIRVTLPEDVVAGVDSLIGKRGRSAFLA